MRFSISKKSSFFAFSPKPFSLNPPLITKTLEFQFAEQSKSNSCDGSKWRFWAPSCYFPVKLGQLLLLRLDRRERERLLMKIHKSPGIKTRAMASRLHNQRFCPQQQKPRSMSSSSLNFPRSRNNNWNLGGNSTRGSSEQGFPLPWREECRVF